MENIQRCENGLDDMNLYTSTEDYISERPCISFDDYIPKSNCSSFYTMNER